MKKTFAVKLTFIFVILALIILAGSFAFSVTGAGNGNLMGMTLVPGDELEGLLKGKEVIAAENAELKLNGSPAAYDKYENCFYICQDFFHLRRRP